VRGQNTLSSSSTSLKFANPIAHPYKYMLK
jgi:hypothetical protein